MPVGRFKGREAYTLNRVFSKSIVGLLLAVAPISQDLSGNCTAVIGSVVARPRDVSGRDMGCVLVKIPAFS